MSTRSLSIFFVSFLFLTGCLAAFASLDTLAEDEAAIAANIKALHSEDSKVREAAAKELRRIIAKYPSGTSNIRSKDGGEAYWTEKANQVVPGMTASEVIKILPPFPDYPENSGIGTGASHIKGYRLDNDWLVSIEYQNPDKVIERPKLLKRELLIYGQPAKNFTGTWSGWYVNGQKCCEIQYSNGKYSGLFMRFHDNGRKAYEQHYIDQESDGPDIGWYPDGTISYTGQYKNGKKEGQWLHYYPNGLRSSEMNFKDGKFNGLYAGWYENGQIRFEMHYLNGVQDGIEAGWNEQGVLQYKRERKDGQVVP